MSHLHIPDGLLPLWLWGSGLVLALALVALFGRRLAGERRLVPTVAVMAAVLLVALNMPLGLPFHLNMAAMAGIVLGPGFGFLTVFVVNVFSALVGHGGLTVLGVNSLLVGSEALVAGALFALLGGGRRLLVNAGVAVTGALLVSTLLMLVVVGVAGLDLETMVHDHGYRPAFGEVREGRFFEQFVKIIAPLVLIWLVLELVLSLVVVKYIDKVKGGWFARG